MPAASLVQSSAEVHLSASPQKLAHLIDRHPWENTVLGKMETWNPALKQTIRIMLESPMAMYLAWGKEYIQFYNDAYCTILHE